jgi:hypothetical protein
MTSRRHFIRSGLALSALSLPAVPAWASAGVPAAARPYFDRFIFDGRFAEAVEVAQSVAPFARTSIRIQGDLTALWYDDLDLAWKRGPMTLSGVTTEHGLFVLETLAADRGMRVVYRGRHAAPAGGRIVHTLAGPIRIVVHAAAKRASFWSTLGDAMTRYAPSRAIESVEHVTLHDGARDRTEALYSWIIAPRSPSSRPV